MPEEIEKGALHPRGREDCPLIGIFAQHGKNWPNRLGVKVCRILSVKGTALHVEGLDAVDGTSVIDIKPSMREFLPRGEIRQPEWVAELMAAYW
jgi:tRNA (Thr-GGU) A37 N-methylase